jgi:hypothetical protein
MPLVELMPVPHLFLHPKELPLRSATSQGIASNKEFKKDKL